MDHQAALNSAADRDSAPRAFTDNMAGIARDMIKIAELQSRLFAVDLRALRNGVLWGLGLALAAGGLLVAALAAALVGTGYWLADVARLSTAAGLLWVALAAVLLAVGLFLAGLRKIKGQQAGLQRSKTALHSNWAALRQVLSRYSGRGSADWPSAFVFHSHGNYTQKEPMQWPPQNLIQRMTEVLRRTLASTLKARKR